MPKEVVLKAEKIKKRKVAFLNIKIILGILILLLLIVFVLLNFAFNVNKFTVTLSSHLEKESGIILYDNLGERSHQRKLFAEAMDNMGDMSISWLPNDIHTSANGGSHNGDNYIAYTFYLENFGNETIDYWYQVVVDDVIKDVDEAVRIVVYLNEEEREVFAKKNLDTGKEENDTIPFTDDYEEKGIALLRERNSFDPGDVDKFTVVIFLEGDDPDCLNNLIGGEIKMHMEIREEYIAEE